ncbi:AAEL013560-PA [Aedes aegypti]|uniref:Large ribosomal subunit protein mL50 n=1 Tax=Aedes aegypti TaxID=7159 RepID=Q16IT0_AEDAE|nr:AAEL013560-PA [Aedes aegypti]
MAAVIRNLFRNKTLNKLTNIESTPIRCYASANRVKPFKKVGVSDKARNDARAAEMRSSGTAEDATLMVGQQIKSVGQSLASRGYLRPSKPYSPPEDLKQTVLELAKSNNIGNPKQKFSSNQQKFDFLAACFSAFKHGVPNSRLHEINSVEDAVEFYSTPVDTTLPLDAMKTVELPENLYIQHEYIRFHPETDTMFGGKSAFPKSSTIVTGLKYKNKYKGHVAKKSWP